MHRHRPDSDGKVTRMTDGRLLPHANNLPSQIPHPSGRPVDKLNKLDLLIEFNLRIFNISILGQTG